MYLCVCHKNQPKCTAFCGHKHNNVSPFSQKSVFFRALFITNAFKQSFLVTVLPKAFVGMIEVGF